MFGNWCFNCQWCRLNTKWLVAARWRRPGGAASHGGSRAVAYLFSISVVSWALEEVNRKENQNFKKKTLTIEKQKKRRIRKEKKRKEKKRWEMRWKTKTAESINSSFVVTSYAARHDLMRWIHTIYVSDAFIIMYRSIFTFCLERVRIAVELASRRLWYTYRIRR